MWLTTLRCMYIENPKFRKFMKDIAAPWDPISARWISDVKLPELASRLKSKITHMVDAVKHLSVTLDIWSDRRMRGITGVGDYGLLQLVHYTATEGPNFLPQELAEDVKFKDVFYLLAPFFDPTIKNEWIAGATTSLSPNNKHFPTTFRY